MAGPQPKYAPWHPGGHNGSSNDQVTDYIVVHGVTHGGTLRHRLACLDATRAAQYLQHCQENSWRDPTRETDVYLR